ncbi:MAG: prolyl-tRNA synthetase associated domain-containing protein [Hyphomicrobiaceae bacterium]
MPATQKDLFDRLQKLGIATETVEHEAVFTVAESDALESKLPGGHTKNLFLKDAKGKILLIVAQSHTDINLKTVHKTIGCARLSFGKPDLMMDILGIEPGSVTAFSIINDTQNRIESVIVDETLMKFETINCHPLVNTATTAIGRDDLLRFIRECGHEPRIMSLNNRD